MTRSTAARSEHAISSSEEPMWMVPALEAFLCLPGNGIRQGPINLEYARTIFISSQRFLIIRGKNLRADIEESLGR